MKNSQYWVCIIGPLENKDIPNAGDSIPRRAAVDAISDFVEYNFECWSGWTDKKDLTDWNSLLVNIQNKEEK